MTPPVKRYTAADLEHMADQLVAFREKLEELLGHTVEVSEELTSLRAWQVPVDGHESQCRTLRHEVSTLAGRARLGIEVAGATARRLDRSSRDQYVLNPVAGWATIMSPGAMMRADEILDATRLAEGKLRADALVARREERSLAGRIAAIVGLPVRIRELAGFSRDSRVGRATQWTASTILITVVLSVIGSGLWALIALALRLAP